MATGVHTQDAVVPEPRRPGHMSDTDAFSWYMERDPLLRSTVVTVIVLESPPDAVRLRSTVDRATRRLPIFRSRLVQPPFRLATPRWTEAAEMDLDWHLSHVRLPSPGDWRQLLELAGRKAATAFDPARPLWEMTVVEGLPDGRAAVVMVFHHSLTDGIGGVQLAMELFDAEPTPALGDRPVPPEHPEDLAGLRLTWESLGHDARRLSGLAKALPRATLAAAVATLRSPRGAVTGTVRTVGSVARFTAPVFRTTSPVMRGRHLARSLDVLEVPLSDLHRAGRATGGHLNDAFLGGVTGGLRRYHEQHGEVISDLHVTLPISLRRPDDPPGGNLITLVRLALPAGLPDPAQRMTAIHDVVEKWRQEPSLALTQPIAMALNLLPPGVVGSMLKHVDFLASNVPGFPIPLYLAGSKVEAYYPFGPTIGASVNITLLSYVDSCCIGVSCDSAAVPDADVLMDCLREGFEEVLDLTGDHRSVTLPGRA
jgi:diacylglycerol O-acyltransferase